MKTLFIFLTIAFICNYIFQAKDKKQVWLISILAPLVSFIAIVFILVFLYPPYEVGAISVLFLRDAIIAGFIIFFQQKRILKQDGKSKFPICLFIFVLVSAGISITQYTLSRDLEEKASKIEYFKKDNDIKSKDIIKNTTLELEYYGLSFSYPWLWNIEKDINTDTENPFYSVACEDTDENTFALIIITWAKGHTAIQDVFNRSIDVLEKTYELKIQDFSAKKEYTFHQFKGESVDFSYTILEETINGRIIICHTKNHTIQILMQCDAGKLDTAFKTIENSLVLEE